MANLTTLEADIFFKTKAILGTQSIIITDKKLEPLLHGFRGKKGLALAAVYPTSITQLYKLIELYKNLNIGYILQGANTALKGQSTPNGNKNKPVIIIKTTLLKKYKILDYPGVDEYKIMLVEPGLPLKEAEITLTSIGFDLPHKIGSHNFGNTFGASCANGCGGVRVDNRDGRASMTQNNNMGVVALSANGTIYNGFIRKRNIESGESLLNLIDQNKIDIDDIELPKLNEIDIFLQKLFTEKSYPIHNHRGEILFAGDGGEGLQAIVYQMYLIRRKPQQVKTYALICKNLDLKERFYKEVIFADGAKNVEALPILCESMNNALLKAIVNQGYGYLIALATTTQIVNKYSTQLLKIRNSFINIIPNLFIKLENSLGKIFSRIFSPREIYQTNFAEIIFIQMANRNNESNSIQNFETKLTTFIDKNPSNCNLLNVAPGRFRENLLLQIRNVGAITTLTIARQLNGELLAFDDAIMPGAMLNKYCAIFFQELSKKFPGEVLPPYLYGHDLKQINHNDWIITRKLTKQELEEIHHLQHTIIEFIGGRPHAEHGIGDYSATDLNRDERIKLVAHRLLNDPNGLSNPGGAYEMAYQQALQDKTIVEDALKFARDSLTREEQRKTLLTWPGAFNFETGKSNLDLFI